MAGTICEVSIIGLGPQGEAIVNVLHYGSDTGSGNTAELDALVDAVIEDPLATFVACWTPDWTGFVVRVTCLAGDNVGNSVERSIADLVGTATGTSAPLQTCAIIRKHTDAGGRHGRGRVFLSPIKASLVSVDGRVTSTNADLMNAATGVSDVLTVLEGTYFPILRNHASGTTTRITSATVSSVAGVMRSRRLRFPN